MCHFSRKCALSHLCDYYSHIYDYNVDVTIKIANVTIICDYYIFG